MAAQNDNLVSAKELASQAGETYDAVDHWSGKDLLCFRRRGRKRLYDPRVNLKLIGRIRELQDQGHSLETIRQDPVVKRANKK
jgi:DNA-binding transcriptional MerR regulator